MIEQTTPWEVRGIVQHTEDPDTTTILELKIKITNHEPVTKLVDSGPTHVSPNKPAKSGAVSTISSRNSVGKATRELANARLHDMEIMRVLLRRHAGNDDRRGADGALRARADANGSIKVSVSLTPATASLDTNNDQL